ncbi:hypothetical protein [Asaia sp. HN128]|uniref:hypothetical protein n=1 Tax=Asaia sp. HN128 TaxID=3081234 RepID=UPI003015D14D
MSIYNTGKDIKNGDYKGAAWESATGWGLGIGTAAGVKVAGKVVALGLKEIQAAAKAAREEKAAGSVLNNTAHDSENTGGGGSSGSSVQPLTDAEKIGILRDAAKGGDLGKGNFRLGYATASEAEELGKAWVGPNYRVMKDGSGLVSQDGLRTYRFPQEKKSSYASTGVQANFEKKIPGARQPISNGHLNITK